MSKAVTASVLSCLLWTAVGCSSSSSPTDAGEPTWWTQAQKAPTAGPLYGVSTDTPAFAVAAVPASETSYTCAELLSSADAGEAWYVSIALGIPANGTTATVGGTSSDDISGANAVVAIYHQEPTQSVGWTAYAVSGQLTLTSFPANAQAIGTAFAGHLTALFPDDPISTIDCQGGGEALPDGGFLALPGACLCQNADGGTFTCDLPVDGGPASCCYGDGGTTTLNHQLSLDFNATGCAG